MYTKNEIDQIFSSGKVAVADAAKRYFALRKKGKHCEETWQNIGFIANLLDAIRGYDPDASSEFCLESFEVEKVVEVIIDQTTLLTDEIVQTETFIILQEDGFNLLNEDGTNLLWY